MTSVRDGAALNVLMASGLDLFDDGKGPDGAPQRKTVEHFARHGDRVTFVTSAAPPRNSELRLRVDVGHIELVRFHSPLLEALGGVRILGWFARAAAWMLFQLRVLLFAWQERAQRFDVFYAYEIQAVLAMKVLAALFARPFVSRCQGTVLPERLSFIAALRGWQHVVALRAAAPLTVMTNDGTRGDVVLRRLRGNTNGLQFLVNGIDPMFFGIPLTEHRHQRGSLSVYCCGRLVHWKNHDRNIRAVAAACREGANLRLYVVGDGPERQRLTDLAHTLGVSDRVTFYGAIPHSKLLDVIARSDVYISNYELSNFGKTMMEAMAGGCAIVTSDVGDTSKFVTHEQHGVVCRDNDTEAMAAALVHFWKHPEAVAQCGARARTAARQRFWSWEERLDFERDLLKALVAQEND